MPRQLAGDDHVAAVTQQQHEQENHAERKFDAPVTVNSQPLGQRQGDDDRRRSADELGRAQPDKIERDSSSRAADRPPSIRRDGPSNEAKPSPLRGRDVVER